MNFRIQEVIKMLVPGTVLIYCLYCLFFNFDDLDVLLKKDYIPIYLIFVLALTYVSGYFIDWFASLFERLFYIKYPKPSQKLLNGSFESSKQKIKLLKYEEIADELCGKLRKSPHWPYDRKSSEELFKVANYLKDQNALSGVKEKLNEFYFYSIFSRNLAISFLCVFVFYPLVYIMHNIGIVHVARYQSNWDQFNWYFLWLLLPSCLCILRWKEHAMYYTRYIFYSACEDILKL